jgi:hypothetical protein
MAVIQRQKAEAEAPHIQVDVRHTTRAVLPFPAVCACAALHRHSVDFSNRLPQACAAARLAEQGEWGRGRGQVAAEAATQMAQSMCALNAC